MNRSRFTILVILYLFTIGFGFGVVGRVLAQRDEEIGLKMVQTKIYERSLKNAL